MICLKMKIMHHNQKKKNEELKPQNLDLNSFEDEAPVLPQESEDDDTYDLQKRIGS